MFLPSIVFGLLGALGGGALIDYFSRRKPSQVLSVCGSFTLVATLAMSLLALAPRSGWSR